MVCVNATYSLHLTEGKTYSVEPHPDPKACCYRVRDNLGAVNNYLKSRFKPEKEQPKMGAIYLICVIINAGLKAKDFDVIPDDLVNETFIEHSLDAAKKKLDSLNAGIQEEGKSVDLVACIFELHSYYENRPSFVEVKR